MQSRDAVIQGIGDIFESDKYLSIAEIVRRWHNCANPKDGFSRDEIMHKIISAFWLGKFKGKGQEFYTLAQQAVESRKRKAIFSYKEKINRCSLFVGMSV